MKAYIKKITSVVLSLAVAVSATSFTKFDNTNAKETEATPQEPSVLSAGNANLEINNLTDLETFRDSVNSGTTYENETVTLKADIDMSSISNWDAIGTYTNPTDNHPFKGTFEGGDHKISNLKIDKSGEDKQGLFGYIEGATIQNLGLENVNVKGKSYVGGLVGESYYIGMTITNCYVTGTVTGVSNAGGLAGGCSYNGSTMTNSYAAVEVTGAGSSVGGLVGSNNGTITNSYSTGKVTGTATGRERNVGGLVGGNSGTIRNSYATGSVTGAGDKTGGLVGGNSGTIRNSYATGSVTGTGDYVGGLVGYNGSTIETSYATGEVTGTDWVGGLVGDNESRIRNSYATGSVTGQDRVGGLVGGNAMGVIYTSFAIGRVTGTGNYVGGLLGSRGPGSVTNSYYDKDTTGQSDTGNGTPLSTDEMTGDAARSNMIGFEFGADKPWNIKQNEVYAMFYPFLTQFGEGGSELLPMAITSSVEGKGKVEDIPANAKYGEEVNFKAIADTDYRIKSVTSEGLTIEDKGSGNYSFTMPKHAVDIEVVFEKISEPTPPIPTPEPAIDTDGAGGTGKSKDNAKTGDKVDIGLISLLTLTAAGALIGLKRKRK